MDSVIAKLRLQACADTRVGGALMRGLSGGERKRASIGYELITNPSLLFLDEPTSGLDSFTSLALIQNLKDLANEGHTVICTIHQPSSEIFRNFDKLNLLVKGRVAYLGPAADSIEFFAQLGYPCPMYTNPTDFFMELLQTSGDEDKERAHKIVEGFSKSIVRILFFLFLFFFFFFFFFFSFPNRYQPPTTPLNPFFFSFFSFFLFFFFLFSSFSFSSFNTLFRSPQVLRRPLRLPPLGKRSLTRWEPSSVLVP